MTWQVCSDDLFLNLPEATEGTSALDSLDRTAATTAHARRHGARLYGRGQVLDR